MATCGGYLLCTFTIPFLYLIVSRYIVKIDVVRMVTAE